MSVAASKLPVLGEPHRAFYRFSVEQYLKMVQHGVLGPDDHVELLEGWVVQKVSRNPPHDCVLNIINQLLTRLLPDDWALRNQSAIVLARSVPEPDISIVRGPLLRYAKDPPHATDVAMLIEVADSSRLTDRKQKGLWYAEAKIPEFWLVNLVENQVEVYTVPKGGKAPAYRQRRDYRKSEKVPLILGGSEITRIPVSQLCPVTA
jgi:Uma2 family endonuclease